jgi:hypothetical protein
MKLKAFGKITLPGSQIRLSAKIALTLRLMERSGKSWFNDQSDKILNM